MHHGPICGRKIIFVMKEDTVMLKRISAIPILIFIVLIAPLQAFAQQPPQPAATPRVLWARALASYVGRWLRLALLVDVPTNDTVRDYRLRCHILLRTLCMCPWVSSLGAAVADVGW